MAASTPCECCLTLRKQGVSARHWRVDLLRTLQARPGGAALPGGMIMTAASVLNILKVVSVSTLGILSVAASADVIPFQSNGRTADVGYQDLDLAKKADQQELKARIRRAAVKVCPARTVQESRSCQLVAIDHVREPLARAFARAQGENHFAEVGGAALPQAGN